MMINSMKRTLWSTAFAGTIGLLAGQANAFYLYPNTETVFEDNDIELLVNATGSANNTLLEKGDKLRGVLTIDTLKSGNGLFFSQPLKGGDSQVAGEEITGIFEVEVDSATFNGSTWDFVFKQSASFEAVYGAGAVLALFSQAAGDLNIITDPLSCDKVSVAECETKATNGTPLFTFGFGADADAQWDATGVISNDVAAIAGRPQSEELGDYNFALDLLNNFTTYTLVDQQLNCFTLTCAGDGKIEFRGSGTINGGQALSNGYDATSDFQFDIKAVSVPEPGSLALVGLALAGIGATARRRKA